MDRIVQHLSMALVIGASTFACSSTKTVPPASTETTSATMVVQRSDLEQLQRDRDEARAALSQQQARLEQDRQQRETEMSNRRARDELATRGWAALDAADAEMMATKDKQAKASPKVRKDIDAAMDDVRQK